jgi:predicted TIM-barrel fold metal-dependent hydrolase
MPSFDVHQHLWPPRLVEALRRRRQPPRLDGDVLELREGSFPVELRAHRLEERIALLDRDGVDTAIVSLQPTLELDSGPELADAYHEGIVELVAASEGRLRAFAAEACLDGFAGACVSAARLLSGLDDLPAELVRAGQVLFVHPGPPELPPNAPAWWAPVVDYTAQMQAACWAWSADGALRHPDLPVVFAILGGGVAVQLERFRSRGGEARGFLHPSLYLETSSYGARALDLARTTHGAAQLLYGSDVPVVDPRPTLKALEGLGDDVLRAVRVDNPTLLFH